MVLITLFLAAAAAATHFLLRDRPYARLVTSVLAAFALLALVTTIAATWDADGLVYLGGVLLLVGGAAGYWYLKGHVFVPVAVLGGAVLLSQVLSDTMDGSDFSSGTVLTVGMLFLVYGLVVAGAGWRFSCRNLAAMLGGGIALAAMWLTVFVIGTAALFVGVAAQLSDDGGPSTGSSVDDARTDMRIAMVLGLLVALALILLYAYTSYSRYLVLAFLGAVSLPATAVALSRPDHPLRWSILFAVLGAIAAALPSPYSGANCVHAESSRLAVDRRRVVSRGHLRAVPARRGRRRVVSLGHLRAVRVTRCHPQAARSVSRRCVTRSLPTISGAGYSTSTGGYALTLPGEWDPMTSADLGCNLDYMITTHSDNQTASAWFTGRLPEAWTVEPPQITVDREEITVVLTPSRCRSERMQVTLSGLRRPPDGSPAGARRPAKSAWASPVRRRRGSSGRSRGAPGSGSRLRCSPTSRYR